MAISFSEEQAKALDMFQKGHNLCMIGPGGSGKTFVIQQMYRWAIENKKNIAVTALTGCAAYLLVSTEARTIHSWSGIYRFNDKEITGKTIETYVKLLHKKRKQCMARWLTTDILIIDEISMMSSKFFTLLDGIGRNLRSKGFHDQKIAARPFGGIQVIVVGDFLQIPPVIKDESGFQKKSMMPIFECPRWREMIRRRSQVIVLKKNFRALHDQHWSQMLLSLRQGRCSPEIQKKLEERLLTLPQIKKELADSDIKPTVLVSTHLQVDAMNIANLQKCPEDTHCEFNAVGVRKDMETHKEKELSEVEMTDREGDVWMESFQNSLVQKKLVLRQGAQVMCVYNIDVSKGLVNGARGVVRRFDIKTGFPVVYWKVLNRETIMEPMCMPTRIPLFYVKQIPLCQAWAITIHKSQGQTLDSVEVDIGESVFVAGQAYVALSRVRSLDTLYISKFNTSSIWADPFSKRFCAAVGDV